jgi:cell division protein FtsN
MIQKNNIPHGVSGGQRGGFDGQRGGFAVGLIVGLLIGLALALGVALYVTKVPIPFVNKVPQRTADQDAAETQKNRNWDPNAPLSGKNPAKPTAPAAPAAPAATPPVAAPALPTASAPATSAAVPAGKASAPKSARDPAAILADKAASAPKILPAGTDPFIYYVQAGAYARTEDAEQQRARLAMMGVEGKVSEREQAGRTVFRVRIGPFPSKADADATKEKLGDGGVEAALVRVQR